MAYVKDQDYKIIKYWKCPNCGKTYAKRTIGIRFTGPLPRYIFCDAGDGCARYFDITGRDITNAVEQGFV